MITLRISNRVVFVGSRVWFDKIDEYGMDSIFKTNGMGTVFYGKHPLEYGARLKVYVFYPRVEHTISTLSPTSYE